MIKLKMTKSLIALVFLAFTAVNASAYSTSAVTHSGADNFGSYLGTFYGPDNEAWFDNVLDVDVDLFETVTSPATSEGFLSIFNLVLNGDGDVVGGEWSWSGPGTVSYVALNSGPLFALYEYTDGLNAGFFNTTRLANKPLEAISVYGTPVPVPAAVWLLLSGVAGLIGFGKRRS